MSTHASVSVFIIIVLLSSWNTLTVCTYEYIRFIVGFLKYNHVILHYDIPAQYAIVSLDSMPYAVCTVNIPLGLFSTQPPEIVSPDAWSHSGFIRTKKNNHTDVRLEYTTAAILLFNFGAWGYELAI